MIGRGTQVIQLKYNCLASGHGDIAICGKTTDPVVNRRRNDGVVNINKLIAGKIWIKGDSQQSTLVICRRCYCNKRSWKQNPVLDDANPALLQANEEPAIGRKVHRRRSTGEVTPNLRFCE